jgi:hypothetical protein
MHILSRFVILVFIVTAYLDGAQQAKKLAAIAKASATAPAQQPLLASAATGQNTPQMSAHITPSQSSHADAKAFAQLVKQREINRMQVIVQNLLSCKTSYELDMAIERARLVTMLVPDDYKGLAKLSAIFSESNGKATGYEIFCVEDYRRADDVFKKLREYEKNFPGTLRALSTEYPNVVKLCNDPVIVSKVY